MHMTITSMHCKVFLVLSHNITMSNFRSYGDHGRFLCDLNVGVLHPKS